MLACTVVLAFAVVRADANAQRHGVVPMLRWACSCLRELLPGEDVNTRDSATGRTLLHRAAADGHFHMARTLLEAGADKDARDKNGRTPLYHAVASNHPHLDTLLRKAYADLDAPESVPCQNKILMCSLDNDHKGRPPAVQHRHRG